MHVRILVSLLCVLSQAQPQPSLLNPNLIVSAPTSVSGWTSHSTTVSSTQMDGVTCTNVSGDGENCPDLYQYVNTSQVRGNKFRFSCDVYSTKFLAAPWGLGLAVSSQAYGCIWWKSPNEQYMEWNWTSQYQPSTTKGSWIRGWVDFNASSSVTNLLLHVDTNKWACFKGCTLENFETGSPTSKPTMKPTTSKPTTTQPTVPTPAPSTPAPTTECVSCEVPICRDVIVEKEPSGCVVVEDLNQISTWTRSPFHAGQANSVICSILKSESNSSCHQNLDRNLYVDACQTLRESIFAGFLPQFNAKWCFNATENTSHPFEQWNSSLVINYTTLSNKAACVERQKYSSNAGTSSPSSTDSAYVALGPLADVLAHPELYPDFPEIKKVQSSQTTGILYNTACLESQAVAPGWYVALAIFLVFAGCAFVLLYKRRKLSPVKARDSFLLWAGLFWVVINFIWISIDQLTGNTASCGLISFGNLVAFPMLLFFYLLRALRLLFLYKWAEGKVRNEAWFHKHRVLVKRNTFLITSGIFLLICITIFTATNIVDGSFAETFLSSGRCEWWDINQQVIAAASEAGVPLLPTDFNPNGFVPYSVEYSSCVFCSTFSTQVLMCIVTAILLFFILVALFLLRNINDQFKLLFELVGVLLALSAVALLRSVMFFPSFASSMMVSVGSDLGAIFLAILLFFLVFISAVYPALLTYTRRFRVSFNPETSTLDGKIENGKAPIVISLSDVLNDQFGLDLYKQFALESFAVENVMYWCAIQDFKKDQLISVSKRSLMALEIYETYIRQGAVMEVNVGASLREQYDTLFGVESAQYVGFGTYTGTSDLGSTITHQSGGSEDNKGESNTPRAPKELAPDIFDDVTQVVFGLMQTNCWLRFKKSPFWDVLSKEMQIRAENANPIASNPGTQMSSFRSLGSSMKSMDASMRSVNQRDGSPRHAEL